MSGTGAMRSAYETEAARSAGVDVVVKVGGALLELGGALDRACVALADLARRRRLLVVPGGGRFADVVRATERERGLDPSTAHWMAILAMNQYAYLLASLLDGGVVVEHPGAIPEPLSAGRIPILAPYRWLRETDPLPHSWDVTSDSIAAWIAGTLGAAQLVLIKPVSGAAAELADAHFTAALPESVECRVVSIGDIESLGALVG
jgi:5-(aminomethyl)-3-furanmethanol phosphate kinase